MTQTILIIEDDIFQRSLLKEALQENFGYNIVETETGKQAFAALNNQQSQKISLVILDLGLPDIGGFELLKKVRSNFPELPVIILTGSNKAQNAVEALKIGAVDYITKPLEKERLITSIKNAIKLSSLSQEVSRLTRKEHGQSVFTDMIGWNGGLAKVITIGKKAATSDIPVLIHGETGVGKELFARSVHGESKRAGRHFIAVNCGAIPENLFESILFGHEKGAFTGATSKTIGKFRESDGGTIFLDEIAELPLLTQVKLLRVLQQKEVEPVGSAKPVAVDVRIISATNRNLEEEVEKGNFRQDLFFRLNGLPINIPPLKYRKQDISSLAEYFISHFCSIENIADKALSKEALQVIESYEWPGNVRELANILHRVVLMSSNTEIVKSDFTGVIRNYSEDYGVNNISSDLNRSNTISIVNSDGSTKSIEQIEAEVMEQTLKHYNGNIAKTCRNLKMAKATFYRKLKKYRKNMSL